MGPQPDLLRYHRDMIYVHKCTYLIGEMDCGPHKIQTYYYYILFQERVNRTWTVQNKIKETNPKPKKKKKKAVTLFSVSLSLCFNSHYSHWFFKIVFHKALTEEQSKLVLSLTQKRCRFLLRWRFLILSGALSTTFEGLKISLWWVYLISLFTLNLAFLFFSFSWKCFPFGFSIPGEFCCDS